MRGPLRLCPFNLELRNVCPQPCSLSIPVGLSQLQPQLPIALPDPRHIGVESSLIDQVDVRPHLSCAGLHLSLLLPQTRHLLCNPLAGVAMRATLWGGLKPVSRINALTQSTKLKEAMRTG